MAEARDEGGVAPVVDPSAPTIPPIIGKYRVTGYLGRGGMGVVLSAQDLELQRAVALKVLRPGTWGDVARVRVAREAQAMARLSHPNVVTVYEVGQVGDHPFIAMEQVTGMTLGEWLRTGDRSWRRILEMLVAAGRGLAAAHAAGLVHRDFKPDNVLVGADERPRVSDFGLVASSVLEVAPGDASEERSVVGGTPAYMAPEQWKGRDVDARADQFAFAVTCWEALWGQRPFAAEDVRDAGRDGFAREPRRMRARRGVPRRVEGALRRALQADREKRWPQLADLLDRLEQIGRDRRLVVAGAALVLALAVAAVAFAWLRGDAGAAAVCRAAGDDLDELWSPARQQSLAAAFAARPEPFARDAWTDVQRTLDEWAADYRGLRVQECHARRSNDPGAAALSAARDRCLVRRRDELAALVTALAKPDATTVQYARAAARGLVRPVACLATQGDRPDSSQAPLAARNELEEVRRGFADVAALRALGKPPEAVTLAEQLARRADTLGWGPLVAESQLELGLSYQAANANAEGERAHARAVLEADAAQDDETRFAATIGLAVAGMNHSRYDDAGKAIESARMIARRLPADERRAVTVDIQESMLAFWRGNYDACVTHGQATQARIAAVLGPQAVQGAQLRETVAHCLYKLDRIEESAATQKEGLAIAEVALGRDHPMVADLLFGLGYTTFDRGDAEGGLAFMREALEVRERTLGASNPMVGVSLTGVGELLVILGRFDEARPNVERARAIIAASWGADSPGVAICERLLGQMARETGDLDAAEAHFRQTDEILRAKRPPGHDERSISTAELGHVLALKGDRSSLALLREAAAAFEASPGHRPADAAMVRYYLGLAMVRFESAAQGKAIIEAACPVLETTTEHARMARACRAALAEVGR